MNKVAHLGTELPLGEWGWKIQFLDERLGFVALESFARGAILKTTDGGDTWSVIEVSDPQGNANLEGVGFIDENTGWVGGWGSATFEEGYSSSTVDGGKTWQDANEIGRFINRFRFFHDPVIVGYSSGRTVYRYSAEPLPTPAQVEPAGVLRFLDDNAPAQSRGPLQVAVTVPAGADRLTIGIWDRFGEHVRQLLDEPQPTQGPRTVDWDVTDDTGQQLDDGSFLLRVTVDGQSESQIVHVKR
ncbi:MAG: FlgD immunoglobulin-like domain containing protein [Pseudonocardiaceae bacterium]